MVALLGKLPASGPDAPITAKHAKLLFEFYGDRLAAAQRRDAPAQVYEPFPEAPACGSSWDGRPALATPDLAAVAPLLGAFLAGETRPDVVIGSCGGGSSRRSASG